MQIKKKLSTFILFFVATFSFFAQQKIANEKAKSSNLEKLSFSSDGFLSLKNDDLEKSSYRFSESLFIKGSISEGKFYAKVPETQFSEKPEFLKPTWGFYFDFYELNDFPLFFGIGNLNASGGVKKINTPSISRTSSVFTNFSSRAESLSTNYKSPSSKENLLSLFYKFDFSKMLGKSRKLDFSFLTNELNDYVSNFHIQMPLKNGKNTFFLGFSETTMISSFSNANNSWFSKTGYFPLDSFVYFSNQISFSGKLFKSRATFNLYENRKSNFDWTILLENSAKLGFFTISFSLFHASKDTIFVPNGSHLKTLEEFFINPYFTFYSENRKSITKIGMNFLLQEKIDKNYEHFFSINLNAGMSFSSSRLRLQVSLSGKNLILGKDKYIFRKESIYMGSLNFSIPKCVNISGNVSYSFSIPEDEQDFSAKTKIYFSHFINSPFNLNLKSGLEFKTTGGQTEISCVKINLEWKKTYKKMNVKFYGGIKYLF